MERSFLLGFVSSLWTLGTASSPQTNPQYRNQGVAYALTSFLGLPHVDPQSHCLGNAGQRQRRPSSPTQQCRLFCIRINSGS